MSCFQYANEHSGKFPLKWQDLPTDSLAPKDRRFREPKTQQDFDWVYFGGYTLVNDPTYARPATVIVVSPLPVQNQQHAAVFADCSAGLIEESKLIEQLSKQLSDRSQPEPDAILRGLPPKPVS